MLFAVVVEVGADDPKAKIRSCPSWDPESWTPRRIAEAVAVAVRHSSTAVAVAAVEAADPDHHHYSKPAAVAARDETVVGTAVVRTVGCLAAGNGWAGSLE